MAVQPTPNANVRTSSTLTTSTTEQTKTVKPGDASDEQTPVARFSVNRYVPPQANNPFAQNQGMHLSGMGMPAIGQTSKPGTILTSRGADQRIEGLAETINGITNNFRTNPHYTEAEAARTIRETGFYAENARVFPSLQASAGGPLPDQGDTPAPEFMAGALHGLASNGRGLQVRSVYDGSPMTRNPDGSMTANSWNNAAYLDANGNATPFLANEHFTFARDGASGQWRVVEHNMMGQTFDGQPRPDNAPTSKPVSIGWIGTTAQ